MIGYYCDKLEDSTKDMAIRDFVNGSVGEENSTVSNGTNQPNNDTTYNTDTYDYSGAMKFIIATILVYALVGVFSIVLTRSRICRRKHTQHRDEELAIYLKNEKKFRTEDHRQKIKTRCENMQKLVNVYEQNEQRAIQKAADSFPFYLYEGVKDFKRTESSPADLDTLCTEDIFEQNPRIPKSIEDRKKKYSYSKYHGKQRRTSSVDVTYPPKTISFFLNDDHEVL